MGPGCPLTTNKRQLKEMRYMHRGTPSFYFCLVSSSVHPFSVTSTSLRCGRGLPAGPAAGPADAMLSLGYHTTAFGSFNASNAMAGGVMAGVDSEKKLTLKHASKNNGRPRLASIT